MVALFLFTCLLFTCLDLIFPIFSFVCVYPVSLLGHHAILHITSFKNRNRKTKLVVQPDSSYILYCKYACNIKRVFGHVFKDQQRYFCFHKHFRVTKQLLVKLLKSNLKLLNAENSLCQKIQLGAYGKITSLKSISGGFSLLIIVSQKSTFEKRFHRSLTKLALQNMLDH